MFDSDISQDVRARKTTRRVFIAAAGAVLASYGVMRLRMPPGVEASTLVHGTPGIVAIVNFKDDGTRIGIETVAKTLKTDGAWYRELGANSFGMLRQADTEMPYSGVSWREHRTGMYRCGGCGTALFDSRTKYESGTGWPSFWMPVAKENIIERADRSLGIERIEVACARCEGHLGHVFSDGPEPTGLRYCMNSAAMRFASA